MDTEQQAIKKFIKNVYNSKYSDASENLSTIINEKLKKRVQKTVVLSKNSSQTNK